MSWRSLRRLFLIYLAALIVAAIGVRTWVVEKAPEKRVSVQSWWKDGKRVARFISDGREEPRERSIPSDATFAAEEITGEGPLSIHPVFFAFALVPGLDGVRVEVDGKVAYATVDDLVSKQAYDHGGTAFDPSLGLGTHRQTVLSILSDELGVPPAEVAVRGQFRRVRMKRLSEAQAKRIGPNDIDDKTVRAAIEGAAKHLARGVDGYGRYRYLVDAPTNTTIPSYNWPRHAGSTYFMAQAADVLDDPEIRFAALRAASCLRDEMMVACGPHRCIADDDIADVGSTALTIIALVEIVRTHADESYRRAIADLAEFLRAQQRPDGELMHLYQRSTQKPINVQYLYYTGEAALALARAHRITNDPRDLDAASRALHYLATKGWTFFGSRYYFSEEHWTCQAVEDLWNRARDDEALAFCSRWHEFQRALQHEDGDSPFDGEGSFGVGPIITPRVTPAASRGEAAGALLEVLRSVHGNDNEEVRLVDLELRRAIAFVLRNQWRPGPTYLFASPDAVKGAFPGSPVDWQVRIDYAQHAGSMLVRWLQRPTNVRYPK